jgi:hypothetical protein
MILTIKNYKAIIGQTLPDTDWLVSDVSESEDYYCFFCRQENGNGYVTSVRLKRDGFMEHGLWKYKFWHPPGHGISQITPDWFGDMENAKKVIGMEVKKVM